jgi:Histone chaperone domain CHZ
MRKTYLYRAFISLTLSHIEEEEAEAEEDDEDSMEEIDLDNIVDGGRRTRGKVIDFATAAEQAKDELAPEDDEDDDYEAPDVEMEH